MLGSCMMFGRMVLSRMVLSRMMLGATMMFRCPVMLGRTMVFRCSMMLRSFTMLGSSMLVSMMLTLMVFAFMRCLRQRRFARVAFVLSEFLGVVMQGIMLMSTLFLS